MSSCQKKKEPYTSNAELLNPYLKAGFRGRKSSVKNLLKRCIINSLVLPCIGAIIFPGCPGMKKKEAAYD